jgi:hypothetical protein
MELLCDEAQLEARCGLFRDNANLDARSVQVCAERTIGSEIVLDAPDGTPSNMGHAESRFGAFGDGVSVGARWVHGLCQTYRRDRYHFEST